MQEVTEMALIFDPLRDIERLTGQLRGTSAEGQGPRWMPMDLYRTGDHFVVNLDLPGVDPGSIDLSIDGHTLTIVAERTLSSDNDAEWLTQERPSGTFVRRLSLGDGLDVDGIHASYENGVMSLTIPVSTQGGPRRIRVRAEVGEQQQVSPRAVHGEVAG